MTHFTDQDVQLAVKRGAYWLDESHPGWETQINLSRLQMSQCDQCVIGQAIGDFYEAIVEGSDDEDFDDWATTHGFQAPNFYRNWATVTVNAANEAYATSNKYYSKLNEVWTDEVRERLG